MSADIQPPFIFLIAGSPGSGKSHLIKYFMRKYTQPVNPAIDLVFVFTGTSFNGDFTSILSEKYVKRYSPKILQAIMQRAATMNKKWLLVFDDCLGSVKWDSEIVRELFSNHRHYGFSIIVAAQYLNKIPPLIRECSWYTMVFKQTTFRSINALYESFGANNYETVKEFRPVVANLAKYVFLLINNRTTDASKKFRKLKAPDNIAPFRILNRF